MDKERIGDFEIFTHPSSNHKQNFILVAEKNISLMCGHKALESLDFFFIYKTSLCQQIKVNSANL